MVTRDDEDRIYLQEWMDFLNMKDAAVARRMGADRVTITRYRSGDRRPDDRKIAQLARALGLQPSQMFQHPGYPARPSIDAMLTGAPDDVVKEAAAHTELLLRRFK